MFKNRGKAIISMVMAAALLLSAVPAVSVDAASNNVTMYVVSEIKTNDGGWFNREERYTYTENGLIKTFYGAFSKNEYSNHEYTYDNKNNIIEDNVKSLFGEEESSYIIKYTNDKKGNPTEFECTGNKYFNETIKYKYDSKGRVKSFSETQFNGTVRKYELKHNKKGQITQAVVTAKKTKENNKYTYSYDKKGFIKNRKVYLYEKRKYRKASIGPKFKNTYDKKGNLTKIKVSNFYSSKAIIMTITYTKITVPKSYKKAIEKQQRCITQPMMPVEGYNIFSNVYW